MRFILASASPRRKELLGELGLDFEVCPSKGEEIIDHSLTFDKIVEGLARAKAAEVFERLSANEDMAVLGADTIVVLNNRILGKPKDKEDAFLMLSGLSGKSHRVYTGMCLIIKRDNKENIITCADCSEVYFDSMTPEEIEEYIATGEPMDKAGAYGIQGIGARFIKKIDGNYQTVVGLNTNALYRILRENGLN